jgi:hypothetical protein
MELINDEPKNKTGQAARDNGWRAFSKNHDRPQPECFFIT